MASGPMTGDGTRVALRLTVAAVLVVVLAVTCDRLATPAHDPLRIEQAPSP